MKEKIAIIGAGPMGLAVAYQLVKDGYEPVIFESDDRIGGMTASFDFGGLEIERFYHFHCISDIDFLEILKELEIDNQLNWVNTKMGYWYGNKLQPWGDPIALLTFQGISTIAKFRYGLHSFLSMKRDNWIPLEKYDAVTWIKRWQGEEAYNKLWKKLFELKFYEYSSNLSAPWIWSRIRRVGRSRYNMFKEKLGYLNGGSKTLLNAMRSYIEQNGGEIRLESDVEKVIIKDNCVTGLISKGNIFEFKKIISTIPLPIVARIIPDLPDDILTLLKTKKNIGVVCVIAKLKRPLTSYFWLNVHDNAMDIPGIIEYSNLNPDVGHIIYVPYYMPQTNPKFNYDDSFFKTEVSNYFKKINPLIKDSDILDIRVHKYYYAQPVCHPNYLNTLPPLQVINGLWIADTSYYYPEDRGISESIGFGRKLARKIFSHI